MNKIILIQDLLRPALPQVFGCRDYQEQENLLVKTDRILKESGVEQLFTTLSLAKYEKDSEGKAPKPQSSEKDKMAWLGALTKHAERSEVAMRCMVLKDLLGEDYRELSVRLAQCQLYRWFCRIPELERVKVPSKSTLHEFSTWLEHEDMERVLGQLREAMASEERAKEMGLEAELDMSVAWVDSTCLKANVHFPVDWVLLKDAVSTLIQAIVVVRKHGLKLRMPEPADILSAINAQTMAMSGASRRKPGGKKMRKQILRKMKKMCKTAKEHGERYHKALDERWEETDLSRKEAEVILRRMSGIIGKIPAAMKQAHERIIGERQVSNADKILSLYEEDIHVVVRGKAGASVEFGNSLFIAETESGFILDHELKRETAPGDGKWLQERFEAMKEASGGTLCGVIGDRGFDSAATRKMLEEDEAFNGVCPKDPQTLKNRLRDDEVFQGGQKRRAQTEGRIGILKNVFLQGVPRAKGFKNRELAVDWAVLAHNLWAVARQEWVKAKPREKAA